MLKLIYSSLLVFLMFFPGLALADKAVQIPILCYHNFNPTVPGSMNMRPDIFESQLNWLEENGFTIIPLKEAVAYLQGKRESLPKKSIVITADDGWQSVYTYMLPIIKKHKIPVTLFIYPGTISSGKHAMTWDELKELQQTGLFDIQGHTEGHPNFKQEKKRRSADSYVKFVEQELVLSKKTLNEKLGIDVTLLAWPFGIYNDYLEQAATNAGYKMAFSIDAKPADRDYRPMAQPRYMILESQSMKTFQTIANGANSKG
ncbi:MAG: polysaccharide deacetylase family protein [Gammaproteobacteria bacterium]